MINDRFKFRVWDKLEKKYINDSFFLLDSNGDLYIFIAGTLHLLNESEKERYVIEFCAGIRDKNGQLIYEGDVVFCESGKAKGVIKFEKGSFVFEWKFAKPLAFLVLKYTDDVEIVGNIHEVEK